MEENKKEAKSFVDKYFPVKQPNPLKSDILDGIFPPKNHQGWKKQGGGVGQSSQVQNTKTTTSDGNSQESRSKSHDSYQKGSNGSFSPEASDPCNMGSSVDYGCRDYYPSSKQHPGGYDRDQEKERKDGYDYPDPENSRGEWWQGSLYY